MMKLYAVRDIKADCYTALHPCANDAIAKRSFLEACNDPNSQLVRYPEDYQLYLVGSWEPNSAELKGLPAPKFIASALEVMVAAREAREKLQPSLPNLEVKA